MDAANARGPTAVRPRFRILSLDGGGIKGTFSAAVLAEIERMTGKRIADHFDLITGTSTGGIIALALGLGLSAEEIESFYESEGPKIFPSTGILRGVRGVFRQLFAPKHSPAALTDALREVFGERRLGEATVRLVIVSYDAVRSDVHLFKTAHSLRFKRDYRTPAVEVALATSAAPTYLPAFTNRDSVSFIDGGIWANCPATVGILEAIAVLGQHPEQIEVLSIGTTAETFDVSHRRRVGGALTWNLALVKLLTEAQMKAAIAQANLLTQHSRLLRVNETIRPGRFSLDDASRKQIAELKALGIQKARHVEPEVTQRFLYARAAPFEPYYKL
ncbi:MAG: patatin-like phospholipase family protein [Candidatus Rokubacteria bacterium]|nr:patatin-like phospholipase family protein [Candidatus Rokubacteria bacterium]